MPNPQDFKLKLSKYELNNLRQSYHDPDGKHHTTTPFHLCFFFFPLLSFPCRHEIWGKEEREKPAKSTQRNWFHVSILHKRLQNINLRTHQIISDVALASRGNSQYFKALGVVSRYLDNRYSGQVLLLKWASYCWQSNKQLYSKNGAGDTRPRMKLANIIQRAKTDTRRLLWTKTDVPLLLL